MGCSGAARRAAIGAAAAGVGAAPARLGISTGMASPASPAGYTAVGLGAGGLRRMCDAGRRRVRRRGGLVGNKAQSVARRVGTVTEQSARNDLGTDVPIYPGAVFDQETTQGAKIGTEILGQEGFAQAMVSYRTSDPPEKVLAYYDKQMPLSGWHADRTMNVGPIVTRTYMKGGRIVTVQVHNMTGETTITIQSMRFNAGYPSGTEPGKPPARPLPK
jgi:hypothetical protein